MTQRIKNWFDEHNLNIMPAQSSEIGSIKKLWLDMKKTINNAKPKNKAQLWEIVRYTFTSIQHKRCRGLIDRI